MKGAAEILQELVAIPSVSTLSNRAVIDHVLPYLPQPWNIALHAFHDAAGIEKVNLVATTQPGDAELALVCHTDTVPYDPAWADAVHPRIADNRLYGRGSCDVKGFLACALAALQQVDVANLHKPLALILTADEEIGCVGAKRLARDQAFRSRYTIIGEPTGLRPVRAGKGYALAEIVVHGVEAHSAFPDQGRSAIYAAARVLLRLESIAEELRKHRDASFDPPFTTLNAGLIRGGSAKNVVPGECRITVEWRPIPGQDPGWVAELIRDRMAELDAELAIQRLDPAFAPAAGGKLASLLESLTGCARGTVAFGTEAAHLSALTSEAVVFGPGDMTVAHKTGEFVPLDELQSCVEHLRRAISAICGSPL